MKRTLWRMHVVCSVHDVHNTPLPACSKQYQPVTTSHPAYIVIRTRARVGMGTVRLQGMCNVYEGHIQKCASGLKALKATPAYA